ncbi:MAG TPA: SIR2 family protein, partial [Thermoanaerobaculia bacterium]|nr:SIR2 family protein [Thermoanaerobaculia bacterium]
MKSIEALRTAVTEGRLVVMMGAGVSAAPPSNLPSWFGFNEMIVDEVRNCALELVPGAASLLSHIDLGRMSVVALSDLIVTSFAGESYFPVLTILDSDRPNANHDALAQLAQRGALRTVITTNFDTLLEQAFRARGIPLRVVSSESDAIALLEPTPCVLLKVHGSVTDASTLRDTVSQKMRGLGAFMRQILASIPSHHHLLIIGFSGADLAFDDDYLPLLTKSRAANTTWVLHPGSRSSDSAARKLAELGVVAEELALGDLFRALGVAATRFEQGQSCPADAAESAGPAAIRSWLHEPHIGPWPCAALCMALLSLTSERQFARELHEQLTRRLVELQGIVDAGAGSAFRMMAKHSLDEFDLDAGIFWLHCDLKLLESLRDAVVANRGGETLTIRTERLRNVSACLSSLAAAYRAKGEVAKALQILETARANALELGAPDLLASIAINHAAIASTVGAGAESVLHHARVAEVHARDAGNAYALVEANVYACDELLQLGEYAAAERELVSAERLGDLVASPEHSAQIAVLRAQLSARRASPAAREQYEAALQLCTSAQRPAVVRQAILFLSHNLEHREFLEELASSLELEDPARELLRAPARDPWFLQDAPESDERRRRLLVAEYRGDATAAAAERRSLLDEASSLRRTADLAAGLADAEDLLGSTRALLTALDAPIPAGHTESALPDDRTYGPLQAPEVLLRRAYESQDDAQAAVALARDAYAAWSEAGDLEGMSVAAAALVQFAFRVPDATAAAEFGRRGLLLTRGEAPSARVVLFQALLAWACSVRGEMGEARRMALTADLLLTTLDDPELLALRPLLSKIHEATEEWVRLDVSEGRSTDPVYAMVEEGRRLKVVGELDAAVAEMDRALELPALTPLQRAQVHAERANVLQSASREAEAADAYRQAARMLREAGAEDSAVAAEVSAATSLRRGGRLDESNAELRLLMSQNLTHLQRARVASALAKTLLVT